jgi:N utilization substance protein B
VTFFRDVVSGVVREQRELDPIIDQVLAEGWPLARIDSIMRQVLRAGLYEIGHRRDVPCRAAIVEYVDVARAFFDDGDEPKVVNAVLDKLGKLVRPDEFGGAKPDGV